MSRYYKANENDIFEMKIIFYQANQFIIDMLLIKKNLILIDILIN